MAMRIVAETARLMGAGQLIPIESAHIDGALYHGDSGTLFAERLVAGGATTAVRATLNVGAIDLTGCSRNRLPPHELEMAKRMMTRLSTAGVRIDLDVRAVPSRASTEVRQPGGVGRIERGRVLQFRAWRADQSLRRFSRHRLRDLGAGARLRFAPQREPARAPSSSTSRRSMRSS